MIRKAAIAALFLLPVLFLIPHLAQFPYQPLADFTDLAVSHYPNALFLQQSLQNYKSIPLWSPTILSGYPFAANPLSGLYYLPGWLAILFPLPLGFNLVVILHLLWGGVGMYKLLRCEGLAVTPALLGALTFEALPKIFSHLGAGHLTLIYAVAWTPWLLFVEGRYRKQGNAEWLFPGAVLGITALADIRWAAYAGLIWGFYCLRNVWPIIKQPIDIAERTKYLVGWLGKRLGNIILAVLIAAPLLLPLAEYTQLSTRSMMTPEDGLTLSMPPGQLLGLIFPNFGGSAEWMVYSGAVSLALTILVLSRPAGRRRAGFWMILLGGTLVFSLGSNFPVARWIAQMPGLDLLRVPPRVLFLSGMCMAVLAAFGLQGLVEELSVREKKLTDRSGLPLFAVTAFTVFMAAGVIFYVKQDLTRIQVAWGAVFLFIATTAIFLARSRHISIGMLSVIILSASLVDLLGVNGLSLDFRPAEKVLAQGSRVAEYLQARGDGRPFRIYSPSYSVPQQTAVLYGLELADGVDPLQLQSYTGFMKDATGVPFEGYSVTMPPFENANPPIDNQPYLPNAEKMALLNVRYVVSEFPIHSPHLRLQKQIYNVRIYENEMALPRAWVQPFDVGVGQQVLSEPPVVIRPNDITIQAKGPGQLVLSEIAYPGWTATIDGQPSRIKVTGGLLRSVQLGEGEHIVQFRFRPVLVWIGLVFAATAWLCMISLSILRRPKLD